jgi:GT2 family glycosyltransferase
MSNAQTGNVPRQRASVVVAMATTGKLHHACMESVRAMIRATRAADDIALWWENEQPHDRCRNLLLERFAADRRWTHLLFVDTDEVVEPDTLDRLLSHEYPLVCGSVPTLHHRYRPPDAVRGVTVGSNVMVFDKPSLRGSAVASEAPNVGYRRLDPDDFPGEPFYCDASGLGLCLIHRSVVEAVERPWCRFIGQVDGEHIGEDVYFFRKAREAGFRLMVDPGVAADHYKQIDLTHLDLLYTDKLPVSPWPRRQVSNDSRRVYVGVRVPRTGWLHVRTLEVLEVWQRRYGRNMQIDRVFADTVRGGLVELSRRCAALDPEFTHVLLLGDDVVPHEPTLGLLASVDAPMVAALTRTLIDGRICWAHWSADPESEELAAPLNIRLPALTEPFEVDAVDAACVLLERDALQSVGDVARRDDNGPDADRVFLHRWCRSVTESTGRGPMVAPLTVERRCEVGLRGLLNLKLRLKAEYRAQHQTVGAGRV